MRLDQIESPKILKDLSIDELNDLAGQIRTELVSTVSKNGGHLASNLGVVELTLALHRVFDMPADKLIFDVGHQSYVHKLLTGRYDRFHTLRTYGGLSGFPKRSESEYDAFETGHASTALSAALGMARARDLKGESHQVIALVGDGAMLTHKTLAAEVTGLILPLEHRIQQRAVGVALLAAKKAANGESGDANALSPNYLRLSQAERERMEREQKKHS